MIVVEVTTPEERDAVQDRALADGNFPIVSAGKILVIGSKELALVIFNQIVEKRLEETKEDLAVYYARDTRDRHCLCIMPNTIHAIQLYGVLPEDYDSPQGVPINATVQ